MGFITGSTPIPTKDGLDEVLDKTRTEITTPPIINQPVDLNAQVFEKPYQHSVINTRFIANTSIITYIPGFEYTIDYYSQVLGLDENLNPYNPTQLAVYQSYHLVKGYQLKLQSELSKSFDEKDNTMTLTGNAIMYPFLIPNKGDMFVGDIGDGNAGLFTITRTEQLERYKQTCWSVDFILSRYMTKEEEININQRVVKTSHFVKNRVIYGQDPLVISDDYNLIKDLDKSNIKLMHQWLKTFYSYEYSTIIVPYPHKNIYDPFIMRAIQTVFDQRDHKLLTRMRYYGCNQEDIDNMTDIFRFIIHKDKDEFYSVFKTTRLVSVRSMHWDSVLHDIRYSRLSDLVYPVERLAGVGYGRGYEIDTEPFCGCSTTTESDQELLAYYENLSVHPVHKDGTYVLSKAFYDEQIIGLSKLEILINDFMNNEAINPNRLKDLHNEFHLWKPQEQFYYGIILYTLTKGFLRMM